ncbi:hypothetical protein TRFO_25956 [Tritrichomonas foetus]|uniref:Uncharacterized protein n=1 Tax=Tritrichomonas foetus TaxID=1144522 RepID=A0A1J4K593_9EUKA|nr:hypothetical protein TRFO_25956 [Tritrichomonas foetus]|eukprot:OHT06154.1 hypothetical protein TRFO_25956 [Tritrichomonas foetus]
MIFMLFIFFKKGFSSTIKEDKKELYSDEKVDKNQDFHNNLNKFRFLIDDNNDDEKVDENVKKSQQTISKNDNEDILINVASDTKVSTEKIRGQKSDTTPLSVVSYFPHEVSFDKKTLVRISLKQLNTTFVFCKFGNEVKHAKISTRNTIFCKIYKKKSKQGRRRITIPLYISSDQLIWTNVGDIDLFDAKLNSNVFFLFALILSVSVGFIKFRVYILRKFKQRKSDDIVSINEIDKSNQRSNQFIL